MAALSLWAWISLAVVMAMWNTCVEGQTISVENIFVLGQPKSLLCSIDTTGQPEQLQWSFARSDGTEQVLTGATSTVTTQAGVHTVTSQLDITVSAADNNRKYYCRVKGSTAPDKAASFEILVYKHPDKPIITGPTTVAGGTNATWICVVDGAAGSSPKVTWRFENDTKVLNDYFSNLENLHNNSLSKNLEIRNVTSTLTLPITVGAPDFKLTCRADQFNTKNWTTTTISVRVSFRPKVTVLQTNFTVTTDNDIKLTCSVEASPSASITWYKDGVAVDMSSSHYIGATTVDPSLIIRKANKTDAGVYICSATNDLGSSNASAAIVLVVRYGPTITPVQTPVFGVVNSQVTVPCMVDAVPSPTKIFWYRIISGTPVRENLIDPTKNPAKYSGGTASSTSNLTIKRLDASDEGQYYCVADNDVGRGIGSPVKVEVHSAPTTPTVTFNQTGYQEGDVITLTCTSTSIPSPQYKWYHKGQVVGTSSTLSFATATPERAGQYRCEASNTVGSASTSVPVIVFYTPRAGSISNVTATLGQTVTLTCAVSAHPPPFSYTWTKDGTTVGQALSSDKLTVKVSKKEQFGRYECRATNTKGQSDPIPVYILDDGDTGESTEDTGLPLTTLILIIVICIVLLVVIILIIIYCCVSGRCRKLKKDNNVSPSVVAAPPPPVVPADEKPLPAPAASTPNGHVASSAPPDSSRSRNGHVDRKADKADPRNKTASLGHGLTISVPGGVTAKPHHLPPLGQDGDTEEVEPARDDKHKRKKRRRRPNAEAAPQDALQV